MQATKLLAIPLALTLAAISPAGGGEVRTFNMELGGPMVAELVDATPQKISYLRYGHKAASRLSDFSPEDQEYLREWMRKNRSIYDWPSQHGNEHDGSTAENLPATELPIIWRAKVGVGDAGVAVGFEKAVTCGVIDGEFVVSAFDLEKGETAWKKSYAASAGSSRAMATPAITRLGEEVFTLAPGGRYDCWKLEDGASVWASDLPTKFPDAAKPAGGFSSSPLLVEQGLFLEVGAPAYSLVRFSPKNGLEKWRIGKYGSRGATPVPAEFAERRLIVCHNQHGLVGRDAGSGSRIWEMPWKQGGRSSALIVPGGRIFLTSPDSCMMVRIEGRGIKRVWENSELCSEFVKPVHHKGALFGFHGDVLVCVDAETSIKRWEKSGIGAGNLIRAGEHLVIQSGTSGELIIANADPEKFTELSRTKVFDGASKTAPVFANGRVFCRSESGDLTCLGIPKKIKD